MIKWLSIFLQTAVSAIRSRRDLAFENLLLRQQLVVMKQTHSQLSIFPADRQFWVFTSRLWPNWRGALHIVKPDTVIATRPPWQNPYVERVIGSIRRERLNHTNILRERHLRRVIGNYVRYYNNARTHLSLDKDAPVGRSVHPPEVGSIVSKSHCGGLHHKYLRAAA